MALLGSLFTSLFSCGPLKPAAKQLKAFPIFKNSFQRNSGIHSPVKEVYLQRHPKNEPVPAEAGYSFEQALKQAVPGPKCPK